MHASLLRAGGALGLILTLAACETPSATSTTPPPDAATPAAAAAEEAAPKAKAPKAGTLAALAPVGRNEARVALFRTSYFGLAIQPKVFVDGVEMGRCTPGVAHIAKVSPGTHQISATTEQEKITTVSIANGETAYINCSIGMGVVVGRAAFERVPEATAMQKAGKFKVQ